MKLLFAAALVGFAAAQPAPIDCKRDFTGWTSCDRSGSQYRQFHINPARYGGAECGPLEAQVQRACVEDKDLPNIIGKPLQDEDLQKRVNARAIDKLVEDFELTSNADSQGLDDAAREHAISLRKFVPDKVGILPIFPCGVHAMVVGANHCDPPRTVFSPKTCKCEGDLTQCDSSSAGVTACEDEEIDLAFVIDGSGSIGASRFAQMKEQVTEILAGLKIGSGAEEIQVAANSFSCSNCHTQAGANFPLNAFSSEAAVKTAIESLKFHGSSTYTGNALEFTIDNQMQAGAPGRRAGVKGAIIVITDGRPTSSQMQKAAEQAARARAMGIKVFAIGVGGTYNLQNLEDMASVPHADTVYELQNFDVAVFKDKLLTEICDDDDTPTDPCDAAPCTDDLCRDGQPRRHIGDDCCACPHTGNDDPCGQQGHDCNDDKTCRDLHDPEWVCVGGNGGYSSNGRGDGDCVHKSCLSTGGGGGPYNMTYGTADATGADATGTAIGGDSGISGTGMGQHGRPTPMN